jgi:Caspase domain
MNEAFTQAHALVIGVGGDLPVTIDDAKAIAATLGDPRRCAIPTENIQVLTDTGATRSGIVAALKEIAGRSRAEDAVTIYYSGHGGKLQSGRRFLVPRDREWLYGDDFTDLLTAIPAQRLLLLLDCCYAGGIHVGSGAKEPELKSVPVPLDVHLLRLRGGGGTVVLSSSKENEESLTGNPYSIFTEFVIRGLCGDGAARGDGYVRVGDLAMYLAQWVPRMTNDRQHPQIDLESADNYPIAYYAAGSKTALALPEWFANATIQQPQPEYPAGPESMSGALRNLRDILAESIPEEGEARRVVHDSGERAGIAWGSGDSISFWDTALSRAHRSRTMPRLFAEVDRVLGRNPDWFDAKRQYLMALDMIRPVRSVDDKYATATVAADHGSQIEVLRKSLREVSPDIFLDSRIKAEKLRAADAALSSVGLIVTVLSARASAEIRQPSRNDLQQLEDVLKKNLAAVSRQLSALSHIKSENDAVQPCRDLAAAATGLLAALSQAILSVM